MKYITKEEISKDAKKWLKPNTKIRKVLDELMN